MPHSMHLAEYCNILASIKFLLQILMYNSTLQVKEQYNKTYHVQVHAVILTAVW